MSAPRLALLTGLALLAFAGNSLLCRLALRGGGIDAASFTALRMASGALALALLDALRRQRARANGNGNGDGDVVARGDWLSAFALFAYAAAFSFAYLGLTAATGALLLFGAVQLTMLGRAFALGERLHARQWLGLVAAGAGLLVLLLPGLQAPPVLNAALMLAAGAAWGVYSLRGRSAVRPLGTTAANFARAVAFCVLLQALAPGAARFTTHGALLAVVSGAIASGLGYSLWYAALPSLTATRAAAVQLSVPFLAAAGAVLFLGEPMTARLALSAAAILGGLALALWSRSAT